MGFGNKANENQICAITSNGKCECEKSSLLGMVVSSECLKKE